MGRHRFRINVAEPRNFDVVLTTKKRAQDVEDDVEELVAAIVQKRKQQEQESKAQHFAPPPGPPPRSAGGGGAGGAAGGAPPPPPAVAWYPATPRRDPSKQLPERVALAVGPGCLYVQGMPRSRGPAFQFDLMRLEKWGSQGSVFEVIVNVAGGAQLDFSFECLQAAELDRGLMVAATRIAELQSQGRGLLQGALSAGE